MTVQPNELQELRKQLAKLSLDNKRQAFQLSMLGYALMFVAFTVMVIAVFYD